MPAPAHVQSVTQMRAACLTVSLLPQVLDPTTNSIKTLAGTGKQGFEDGVGTRAQLAEPGGLAVGPDNTAYIADTNNSLIRYALDVHNQLVP